MLLNVPEQYPLMPPAVRYRTKIFHPNVHFKVRKLWHRIAPKPHPAFCRGHAKRCTVHVDGRNLLGHPEDRMDAGVDAASRVPGHHGADVRLRAGQPTEL